MAGPENRTERVPLSSRLVGVSGVSVQDSSDFVDRRSSYLFSSNKLNSYLLWTPMWTQAVGRGHSSRRLVPQSREVC
jgi:hypothetical protein